MKAIAGLATVLAVNFVPFSSAWAEALQFDCIYTQVQEPSGSKSADFNLKFTLDTITNKAFMVGNNGLSEVVVVGGSYGLTFLETLPTGAVQSTTITKGGKSVHSRHSMMGEEIIPSQYYGACQ